MRIHSGRPEGPHYARRDAVRIALAALGLRVLSAVVALLVVLAFPLDHPIPDQSTMWGRPSPFWDTFVRHDSGWYFDIARNGYNFSGAMAGGRSNIAYAPVYPLLMRYVGRLFGRAPGDVYLGGIVVSWVSFVAAMVALYHLAALDLPRHRAARAVLLTAIFPFSFFFGAVYTESLFLLLTVLSFYCFRTCRWAPAGVSAGLATGTRVTGILMWPALAWTAWRTLRLARAQPIGQRCGPGFVRARPLAPSFGLGRDSSLAAAALVVASLGFAGYSFYIYQQTGQPFLWATALTRWGAGYRPGGAPWSAPLKLVAALVPHPYRFVTSGPMAMYDVLYGVTALLFVAATPFVWRKFGAGYGVFMALNLYVPLSSGTFEGLGRYCSVLFPCFIWLASIRSRSMSTVLVVAFAMFYTLGLALFTTLRPLF